MRTARIVAQLKMLPIYTCSRCGREQAGTTVRGTVDCLSPRELNAEIERWPITSQDMPFGWSFNGEYTCGCTKQQET